MVIGVEIGWEYALSLEIFHSPESRVMEQEARQAWCSECTRQPWHSPPDGFQRGTWPLSASCSSRGWLPCPVSQVVPITWQDNPGAHALPAVWLQERVSVSLCLGRPLPLCLPECQGEFYQGFLACHLNSRLPDIFLGAAVRSPCMWFQL